MKKTFAGFGFGPIQSALFLFEAYRSGNFGRFVVGEIDPALVEAVRRNQGAYTINVASASGITQHEITHIEMLNPQVDEERETLIEAIAEADELATALPSVRFFDVGRNTSVAATIAAGIERREPGRPALIYAAENHNHAAEILEKAIQRYVSEEKMAGVQILNTVVGKMSGVISDPVTMRVRRLETITPDFPRAILVEEFNRILVSRVNLANYQRGIDVFVEKDDLLPFEEAKLYGHNAIHALIAYLSDLRGLDVISQAGKDEEIMQIAREAFLKESGETLIRRHKDLNDPLFTPEGYREYADDLLGRMVNPNLNDLVDRVGRDHVRKLGYDDRLYGTMHLALTYDVKPENLALGAAAGVVSLIRRQSDQPHTEGLPIPETLEELTRLHLHQLLTALWKDKMDRHADTLVAMTWNGLERLREKGFLPET